MSHLYTVVPVEPVRSVNWTERGACPEVALAMNCAVSAPAVDTVGAGVGVAVGLAVGVAVGWYFDAVVGLGVGVAVGWGVGVGVAAACLAVPSVI
jgi:S-formylglutathione hydrolase FrmB